MMNEMLIQSILDGMDRVDHKRSGWNRNYLAEAIYVIENEETLSEHYDCYNRFYEKYKTE